MSILAQNPISFYYCSDGVNPCGPAERTNLYFQDCRQITKNSGQTHWVAGQGGFDRTASDEPTGLCVDDPVHDSSWDPVATNAYAGETWGEFDDYQESGTWDNGDPYTDTFWIRERFVFDTGRPWPAGAARQYTVRAAMSDGHGPLPFDWFTIRGQRLTTNADANADGTGWGQTTVTIPAGVTNLDVTPTSGAALKSYQLAQEVGGRYIFQEISYGFRLQVVKDKLYWQNAVMDEIDGDSGVAIENYKASRGFLNNRANFQAVYAFYQKVFKEQPTEYYWMGLGRMAGSPLYAGLSDAEYFKDGLIVTGHPVTALDAGLFQQRIIQMSIDVYSDVAWQFCPFCYTLCFCCIKKLFRF